MRLKIAQKLTELNNTLEIAEPLHATNDWFATHHPEYIGTSLTHCRSAADPPPPRRRSLV